MRGAGRSGCEWAVGRVGCRRRAALLDWEVGALGAPTSGQEGPGPCDSGCLRVSLVSEVAEFAQKGRPGLLGSNHGNFPPGGGGS